MFTMQNEKEITDRVVRYDRICIFFSFFQANAYNWICAYKLRTKKRNALSQNDPVESQDKQTDIVR